MATQVSSGGGGNAAFKAREFIPAPQPPRRLTRAAGQGKAASGAQCQHHRG